MSKILDEDWSKHDFGDELKRLKAYIIDRDLMISETLDLLMGQVGNIAVITCIEAGYSDSRKHLEKLEEICQERFVESFKAAHRVMTKMWEK